MCPIVPTSEIGYRKFFRIATKYTTDIITILMDLLKRLIPQKIINISYHLPKAALANILYKASSKRLKVIGVTGTDGKTTTTNMIYKILKDAGKKVSMISTINAVIADKEYETGFHVTSPDPFTIQKFVKEAADYGDEYLVLEVTSHAIDQFRVWGIGFEVGVITNITHEHLDYHNSFKAYTKTKLKLLKNSKHMVVNKGITGIKDGVVTFGLNDGDFNQKDCKLKLKLPGEYNIENGLAAIAATSLLGVNKDDATSSLESFANLSGRMEEVKNNLGIKIIVDFAHTPNGLQNVLQTLRAQTHGKIISVFGAAGKRDESKRPLMAKIVQNLSDFVVITAEDPRGSLEEINKQLVEGAETAGGVLGKNLYVIEDRGKAIEFALRELAEKGDVVGIFGKGHERSMNLDGKNEVFWSDIEMVEKIIHLQWMRN